MDNMDKTSSIYSRERLSTNTAYHTARYSTNLSHFNVSSPPLQRVNNHACAHHLPRILVWLNGKHDCGTERSVSDGA